MSGSAPSFASRWTQMEEDLLDEVIHGASKYSTRHKSCRDSRGIARKMNELAAERNLNHHLFTFKQVHNKCISKGLNIDGIQPWTLDEIILLRNCMEREKINLKRPWTDLARRMNRVTASQTLDCRKFVGMDVRNHTELHCPDEFTRWHTIQANASQAAAEREEENGNEGEEVENEEEQVDNVEEELEKEEEENTEGFGLSQHKEIPEKDETGLESNLS